MAQQIVRDPEEAYVGKELGSIDFVADDEVLTHYFEGLNLGSSWYAENSPYGKPVVPTMVLTNVDRGYPGSGFKDNFGTLWIRQEWELHKPMFPDVQYRASARVEDVYEHRNRTVVKQEVNLWSPDNELMAHGLHHQSFLLGHRDEGKVKLRDPKAKEGARQFAVPKGEDIGNVENDITLEMCGLFFHGNANYHTNEEAAKELGFERVVVGGRMTMSYFGELLEQRFGKGWFEGGKMDIKFTNIVWPDDHIVARGVITDRTQEDGGTRAHVAIWMEKPDGTVVIVGTASALE